ncbi:MAG: microviridin/marinostatin family tricyclic proteinase inhibitor [Moorea sp. SIO3G5]|nr:microviridin/marinostatin family tricyclic proteinase inhibitor [Moorena sp. SIO3G5]
MQNQESNTQVKPFFAQFLEEQKAGHEQSEDTHGQQTQKYPSDQEDGMSTQKYPSDFEED